MNWSRGLFRLWLVGALLWMAIVGIATWPQIRGAFSKAEEAKQWDAVGTTMLPVNCKAAKGNEGTDFKKEEAGPWVDFRPDPTVRLCWYEAPKFRPLFPEYADLSDRELADKLYAAANLPISTPHPWSDLASTIAAALGPPVLVLVLGGALLWALTGFKQKPAVG